MEEKTELIKILERFEKEELNINHTHYEIVNYILDQHTKVYEVAKEKGYNDGMKMFLDEKSNKKELELV